MKNLDLSELNKPVKMEDLKKMIFIIYSIIIFLLPIIPEVYMSLSLSFKCVLFISTTLITLLLLGTILLKEKKFNLTIYDKLFIIYIFIVLLSTIFTKFSIYNSIFGYSGRGEGFLTIFCYVSAAIIFSRGYKYIKKYIFVAIIGAVIVSIYGIIQANVDITVILPFNSSHVNEIAEGTMGNQNFLSSYLCIFLPSLCYYFLNNGEKYMLLFIVPLFAALVYSKTLSGYLVCFFLIIALSILSIIFSKERKKQTLRVIALILVLTSIYILIFLLNGNKYVKEFRQAKNEVSSVIKNDETLGNGRLAIWKRTLMVIKNNIFLGVGPDNLKLELFNSEYNLDINDYYLAKQSFDKAHSEYLQIGATTGIFSLFIYVYIILNVMFNLLKINIYNIKKNHKEKGFVMGISIGIIAYLTQALVNISVVQVAPTFWAMLGIGIGIIENKKENEE